MARQYDIFFLVYTTISLSLPLSLPAHLPFPDIWLATEEIDLEEDQFLHVERIQPVGESCSYSLHNRDRCGEQVKTNFKQFQTVLSILNPILRKKDISYFQSQDPSCLRGDLPQVSHFARRGSRSRDRGRCWCQA